MNKQATKQIGTPLQDRVIIRRADESEEQSLIVIPDNAKEKPLEGVVVAVGEGKRTTYWFYSRLILTLAVWGLAYRRMEHRPSWRDIGRRKRDGATLAIRLLELRDAGFNWLRMRHKGKV